MRGEQACLAQATYYYIVYLFLNPALTHSLLWPASASTTKPLIIVVVFFVVVVVEDYWPVGFTPLEKLPLISQILDLALTHSLLWLASASTTKPLIIIWYI